MVGFLALFSITVGAHRLFSHKAFKASKPLRISLIFGFLLAGQNSLWEWVRDHRQHHRYSDTDADPHNAKRGFFFCHTGWLLMRKLPEVIEKGKETDMSDINADKWIMFQKKYYGVLFFTIGVFIPVIVPVILWDETLWNSFWLCFFSRYVTSLHFTWCVNSVAHFFGNKPYTKDMLPVETGWVSFITGGEGWHNFHHTFPWDYRASEYGRLNTTTAFIDLFAKLGWVTDLRYVSDEVIACRIAKKGDGSHPLSKDTVGGNLPEIEFETSDIFGNKLAEYIHTMNKSE
ncbi:acyl-CoA Delta-9 desaturase-like isoform X2 [Rhodnius prolixus]